MSEDSTQIYEAVGVFPYFLKTSRARNFDSFYENENPYNDGQFESPFFINKVFSIQFSEVSETKKGNKKVAKYELEVSLHACGLFSIDAEKISFIANELSESFSNTAYKIFSQFMYTTHNSFFDGPTDLLALTITYDSSGSELKVYRTLDATKFDQEIVGFSDSRAQLILRGFIYDSMKIRGEFSRGEFFALWDLHSMRVQREMQSERCFEAIEKAIIEFNKKEFIFPSDYYILRSTVYQKFLKREPENILIHGWICTEYLVKEIISTLIKPGAEIRTRLKSFIGKSGKKITPSDIRSTDAEQLIEFLNYENFFEGEFQKYGTQFEGYLVYEKICNMRKLRNCYIHTPNRMISDLIFDTYTPGRYYNQYEYIFHGLEEIIKKTHK